MKSKICGISTTDILEYITSHPYSPDLIGFICNFKKSKRFVNLGALKNLLKTDRKKSKYVAVLVRPSEKDLKNISALEFDYYQIYDMEPKEIKFIKKKYNKKIIVAITVKNENDVKKYKDYLNIANIFLFDSKGYEKSLSFNHTYLKDLPGDLNIMIAGNFKPLDNFNILEKKFNYVDISGGVESENGIKDKEKINQFLLNIKKNNDKD
jgi:phosphoribosylanthranilate isomerase